MTNSPEMPPVDRLLAVQRALGAAMTEMLAIVQEVEASGEHRELFGDIASWLTWHLGISLRTARRIVRVSAALADLPLIREALAVGAVSWDQVLQLVKAATPDTEAELLDRARDLGADDLRDELREDEPKPALEPGHEETLPIANVWWHDGALRGRFEVPGADGVVLEEALLRLAAKAPRNEAGLYRDPLTRKGEALVQMASESLAADGDHDRATVVVHAAVTDLVAKTGTGWDEMGRLWSQDEITRILCDARLQIAVDDARGFTVGVGRTTRQIAPWLRRLVTGRDGGCRFPGCGRTRWLHIHHLVPWSEGGPTNLDNLISLCGFHHRLIHARRWTIDGVPGGELTFANRRGVVHRATKDRFPPGWDEQFQDMITYQMMHRRRDLAGIRAGPG